MNSEFTHEQIEKMKECKNAEELVVLAKENGIVLTEAMAMNVYAQLNPTNGMLSDNELEAVAGGCDSVSTSAPPEYNCPRCSSNNTKYLFSYSDGSFDIDHPKYFYRCNQCKYEFCFRKE